MTNMTIHPDDILLFTEVVAAMRRVARKYGLPLRNISGYPMPKLGFADRMGDCNYSGDIRLVLRCTENGQWCQDPISPDEVWDTAAHELTHLRHMNHGLEFQDFYEELQTVMQQYAQALADDDVEAAKSLATQAHDLQHDLSHDGEHWLESGGAEHGGEHMDEEEQQDHE